MVANYPQILASEEKATTTTTTTIPRRPDQLADYRARDGYTSSSQYFGIGM